MKLRKKAIISSGLVLCVFCYINAQTIDPFRMQSPDGADCNP